MNAKIQRHLFRLNRCRFYFSIRGRLPPPASNLLAKRSNITRAYFATWVKPARSLSSVSCFTKEYWVRRLGVSVAHTL